MTIKRDLSDLPTGWRPDPETRFGHLLADRWRDDEPRPTAHGTPTRISDAHKCARAVGLTAAGVPGDPMDDTGVVAVTIGSWLHDELQAALAEAWPGRMEAEVPVMVGDGLSGHGDVLITTEEGRRVAIEIKSVGGWGFKAAIGAARAGWDAEGPRAAHVAQGAIFADAVDAHELVIIYVSKEAVSTSQAERHGVSDRNRWIAEWTIDPEVWRQVAATEAARLNGIADLVTEGLIPACKSPELPAAALIIDPLRGAWAVTDADGVTVDVGTHWECGYCRHLALCATLPTGRVPVEDVVS